ncbi:unnamed protein product [Paramecium pentaurelia]|uniref:PSI domain-containing protein n=1 Tax=Paramecium pentaurelia TaxID=43138 RepID=A0A8S1TK23_9CILI|nr:unnamed protein product [Paramecium pentaurelia]
MKFILISITLLLFQVNSLSVNSNDVCQCTTIQAQSDCLVNSKCKWDGTTNKCQQETTTTTTRFVSKLCTDSKTCSKQQGCVFSENKCIMMGDCQSYLGNSNAECQKYSSRCNYNKELKTCTSSDVCSQYSGEGQQTECESITQLNGDKWCKFDTTDNKCLTKKCSDYEKTTDADCAAALQDAKCVSDKKKCLSQLVNCDTYTAELCLSVNALNGPCELKSSDKTKCQSKTCEGATDSKTDTACDSYLKGCITNNLTCFQTLPSCSTYSVTDCPQVKGNKGTCILTSGETPTCRDPKCEDYTEGTDEACKTKDPSCITNGAYCVLSLADKCDSYTTGNCDNIFTKEGKCKSTDTDKCGLDQCTNQSKTTNEECGKYSGTDAPTCITNGVSCVKSLEATCSLITVSESSNCEQYISKEGKCKLKDGSISTCELDSCNTKTFTTDEECNKYSSQNVAPAIICKTNGLKCVDNLNTCDSYLKEEGCSSLKGSDGQCMDDSTEGSTKCILATCDKISSPSVLTCPAGNSTCKFDGVNCVKDLKTCENYTSNCDNMISSNAKACTTNPTDSSKCITKSCATAPATLSTNEECNKYFAGCVTRGQGCIALLSTCDTYNGIKSTCEKYFGTDGKCTADDANKAEDKCKSKDCANATSVTNDQQCNAYSNICFYSAKIQKCQKKVTACNGIKSQTECENSLTSEASVFCTWNGAACVQATCNTIQNVKNKETCAVYGANCEYDNISGCKDKTNYTCSTLRTASLCLQDSASNACIWDSTNKTCIMYNKCSDYSLTPAKENEVKTAEQIASETEICKLLSNKCYSNGGNTCVSKTPCSVIKEEKNCIGSIGIDDKVCGYDAKATACKTFGQCSDVELLTHADCQKYSPTCTTDGKTCVAINNCSDATTKEICDLGGIDGKCAWSDDACSLWTCEKGTGATHEACNKLSTSCTTDGTKCMNIGECSSYTDKNCVLGLKNTPCFYDKEKSTCRNKVCTDYSNVTSQDECDKAGCAYDPEAKACIAIDKCSLYKKEAICNLNKQADKKECVWRLGKVSSTTDGCLELNACSNASSNQAKCEKMSNCYFVPSVSNGTTTTDSECKNMDCYGKNQQVTTKGLCNPFKTSSSDGKSETVTFCNWSDTQKKCIEGDPSVDLKVENCFTLSQYTYYWNVSQNKCVSCKGGNTQTNNTTNQSGSNNDSINSTDNYSVRLELIIYILLLFYLI